MKNILFYFFVVSILFSCSTNKENYKLINDLLIENEIFRSFNDFEKGSNWNVIDSILLSDKNNSINEISNYSLDWDSLNYRNAFYHGVKIIWVDSNKKISLSKSEMDYLRSQMTNETLNYRQKYIKSKSIIVIDKDSIFNDNYEYSYVKKKKVYLICNFTKPIFNKSKTLALIGFYTSTNSRLYNGGIKNSMLILKKVNHHWKLVGYERDIGLSN